MGAVHTFKVIGESIRTTVERGPTLMVLFLFLGLTSYLAWNAAVPYGFHAQIAVAVGAVLLAAAADIIALNTLIDSSTKLKLSSMYLTDYKGIAWTTATLMLGAVVFKTLLFLCAALFLIPFLTGGTALLTTLIHDPYLLSLPQWYTLFVQLQSLLLTMYVATRLMLFPVFIAVESKSFLSGMKQSIAATHQQTWRLVPVMVLVAFSVPSFLLAGHSVVPIALRMVSDFSTVPYVEQVVTGGVYALFLAAGLVLALSLLATAYSQFK